MLYDYTPAFQKSHTKAPINSAFYQITVSVHKVEQEQPDKNSQKEKFLFNSNFSSFKMKLAAITTLLPLSFADFAAMEKQFNAANNQSSSPAGFRSATNFNTFANIAFSSFHEYGCWCYLDGQPVNGKSNPVNAIDGFCKSLADGYACASMDESPNACNAWEVSYVGASTGSLGQNLIDQCNANNADTCAQKACIVEGNFIAELQNLMTVGNVDLELSTYQHSQGFNVDSQCTINRKPPSDKQCCGEYPNRFPYRTSSEGDGVVNRACCNGKTYDSNNMICCSDGSIQLVCM